MHLFSIANTVQSGPAVHVETRTLNFILNCSQIKNSDRYDETLVTAKPLFWLKRSVNKTNDLLLS